MIKILDDSKALNVLVNDTTNGLGQIQPNSATVTEELNGIFEADITLLDTDPHFNDLKVDGLLWIQTGENNSQMFRIYYISKPLNHVVTVKCEHITYDLNKVPVKPFTSTGAVQTKNRMLSNIVGTYPFTMTTNITNTTSNFTLDVPKSFRECLGGWEGSILDVFRCEYEWDNLTVRMLSRRGADNDVRIAYGKNLTDLNQEENIQSVYTGVLGFARKDDVTYVGNIYNKVTATYPRIKIVDFTNEYQNSTPTVADLTQKAQTYATNNDIEKPNVSISIAFVPLYQTEEYKNIAPLERVSLGDTVHVYFDKLGVEVASRVVKTVWNVNLNRYDSVELGSAKSNLNTVINDTVDTAVYNAIGDIDLGFIEGDLNNISRLVINGLGLYFTKEELGTGGYRYILHNKPTLAASDTQYYMSAGGIMVSNDYGQTWVTGYDPQTGLLSTQALSTIILRALEIYGSFLRFGSEDSNYIDVAPYSISNVPQGVSFDGTGTIRMQPQGQFIVNNSNGATPQKNYNVFNMNKSGSNSSNMVSLYNYDDSKTNYPLANSIVMEAHLVNGSNTNNELILTNFATVSGTARNGNQMFLRSVSDGTNSTSNYFIMYNYAPRAVADSSAYNANAINYSGTATQSQFTHTNYKVKQGTIANRIWATTSLSGTANTNYAYMDNYNSAADSIGNRVQLLANTSNNRITLTNHKLGVTTNANYVMLEHSASADTLELKNYALSYDRVANELTFSANANERVLTITNNKLGENVANKIEMSSSNSTTTGTNIRLQNYIPGTSNNLGNSMIFTANTTANTLSLENYNSSGTLINYIHMNEANSEGGSNRQTRIWAESDLKLYSGGAVRLKSNGGQDIQIIANDDLDLQCADKFYLTIAGVQKQVYFSGNYLMIA